MNSYSCCTPSSSESHEVSSLASILKVVSEANRLKIICILRQGKHCVCDILTHTRLSQSLISHHLADLKAAGVIKDEKQGQFVNYSLTSEGERISDLLFQIINKESSS
jgi:ArsR family transcriptional regulator